MKIETVNINKIKKNPNNPRVIKDHYFEKLKKSIQDFPEMLELREVIVDENFVILGGNMRYTAMKDLGIKQVTIKIAEGLTEDQKKEFIIKDNVGFGEWDFDMLANEWDSGLLQDWGLEIPNFETNEVDFSDKNKEVNIDDFANDKYFFKLEYTQEEYELLKDKLEHIGKTPEQIFYEALI